MEKLTKKEFKEIRKLERLEEKKEKERNNFMKNLFIWIGIIIVVAGSIFGLAQLVNNQSSVLSGSTVKVPVVTKQDMTLGNSNAKVVLVEYSDFQCPACAAYHPFVKQLMNEESDKILFVYRFFPLQQHKYGMLSAQIAYSAGLQGKFGQMQDLLFENQTKWAESDNANDIFLSYAKSLNLDMNKFGEDLKSDQTKNVITDSYNGGVSLGINSTPTFFLNSTMIQFRNYDELKKLVENKLNK